MLSLQNPDRDAYLEYGRGFCAPASWRNFDASPTPQFERIPIIGSLYSRNGLRFPDNVEYGDIIRGLPVADGSCRAVYCSHVLEHLSLDEFRRALRNTRELLQGGAMFRLVMPDFEECVKAYTSSQDADAAIRFMSTSGLGMEGGPSAFAPQACCPRCSAIPATTGCGTSRPPGLSLSEVVSGKSGGPGTAIRPTRGLRPSKRKPAGATVSVSSVGNQPGASARTLCP